MLLRLTHRTLRLTKAQARSLGRFVNWLDQRPQWAACLCDGAVDLEADGLKPLGLVRTAWFGDRLLGCPTKVGWEVLQVLHPQLRTGATTRA
jgi:hypothetical protein